LGISKLFLIPRNARDEKIKNGTNHNLMKDVKELEEEDDVNYGERKLKSSKSQFHQFSRSISSFLDISSKFILVEEICCQLSDNQRNIQNLLLLGLNSTILVS